MARPHHLSRVLLPLSAASLLLTACGPAGIAAGIGSLGGGGGGGVVNPTLTQISTEAQPNDGNTQLTFAVDRAARFTLTYAVAGVTSRQSVGANSVVDGAGNALTPVDTTAQGYTVWQLGDGSQTLRWLHEQDLGRKEERGIDLFLGTANADGSSGDAFSETQILQNARVGRSNGVLAITQVAPGANEGELLLNGELTDRAGDLPITTFDIEWRVTGTLAPGPWTAIPRDPGEKYPTGVDVSELAGTPTAGQDIVSQVNLVIDTLAPAPDGLAIPRGRYTDLEFRVTWREEHTAGGGFGAAVLPDQQVEAATGATDLGLPAQFVVEPEIPDTPGFFVPIELRIKNPSRFPSTYRFSGTYTFDDGTPGSQGGPMALRRADTLTLLPEEERLHFIVWDARADVGLGLIPAVNSVPVAVTVTAKLETTGTGTQLSSVSAPSSGAPINTAPFVSFDTPLIASGADQIALKRDPANGSQQIFIQEFPARGSSFSSQVRVDQQFAPIQTPNLQPFDAGIGSGGLLAVIPTDFSDPTAEEDAPDCVVRPSNGSFQYLEFNEGSTTAIPVPGPNPNGQSTSPRMPSLTLDFNTPQPTKGAVAFNYSLADSPSFETTVHFFLLREDGATGNPVGDNAALADETRTLWPPYYVSGTAERNWRYPIFAVAGEFDQDPATQTVVLAEASCFHSEPGVPRGFLDIYAFRDQGGTISGSTVQRVPTTGIELTGNEFIRDFAIEPWRDPNDITAQTGLLLVRERFDAGSGNVVFETFTISRDPAGGWAPSWTQLTGAQNLASSVDFNNYASGRLFIDDLDRDGKVDPLLAVSGRDYWVRFASGNGFGSFQLSNTSFRYSLTTTFDQPNIQITLRDIASAGGVFQITLARNGANQTVWRAPVGVFPWVTAGSPALELIVEDTTNPGVIIDSEPLVTGPRGLLNFYLLANPTHSPPAWRKGLADDVAAASLGVPPSGCAFNRAFLAELIDVNGDRNLDLLFKLSDCEPLGGGGSDPFDQQVTYFASALSGVAQELENDFGNTIDPSRRPGFFDLNQDGLPDLISRGALYLGDGRGRFRAGSAAGFVGGADTEYWLEQVLPPPLLRSGVAAGPTLDITAYTNTSGLAKRIAVDTIVLGDDRASLAPSRFAGRSIRINEPPSTVVSALRPATHDPMRVPSQGIAKDLVAVMSRSGGTTNNRLYRLTYDPTTQEFVRTERLGPDVNLIGDLGLARAGDLCGACDITDNETPQDLFVATPGGGGLVYWLPVAPVVPGAPNRNPWPTDQVIYTARASESIRCIETGLVNDDDFEDLTVVTAEATTGAPVFRVYLLLQDASGGPRFRTLAESDLALRFEVPVAQGAQEPVAWGVDPYRDGMANGVLVSSTEIRVLRPETDGAGNLRLTLVRSPIEVNPSLVLTPNTGVLTTDFDLDGIPEILGGVPTSGIFRVRRDTDPGN